jgi:hypothetical protein
LVAHPDCLVVVVVVVVVVFDGYLGISFTFKGANLTAFPASVIGVSTETAQALCLKTIGFC